MNPFGTRGRVDAVGLVLDGGPASSYGGYALVAGRLRTAGAALAPATGPSAEFRGALRTRLMAVAAVQSYNPVVESTPRALEAAVSWTQARRVQRGIGIAAGAMASVVAVAGIAVAGSQSLPGDPFYGVKKGTEALELRTVSGDVAKGSKHLEFAAARLSEVRGLTLGREAALGPMAPGSPSAFGGSMSERVRSTLAAMDDETRSGQSLLQAAYRSHPDPAPLRILSTFASTQSGELRALLDDVPAAVRPRLESSLQLVTGVGSEADELLGVGTCTSDCAPSASAPQLPVAPGASAPAPGVSDAPCGCQPGVQPTPAPTAAPAADPTSRPEPDATPEPTASGPSPRPTPSPTPTQTTNPVPVPVPVPVPSQPVPVPTLPVPLPTLSPLVPQLTVQDVPALPVAPSAPAVPLRAQS